VGTFIADYACNDPKVIVECDGGQHADNTYDAARDAWFQRRLSGAAVLEREIIDHPESVELSILKALGGAVKPLILHRRFATRAPPSPPKRRR